MLCYALVFLVLGGIAGVLHWSETIAKATLTRRHLEEMRWITE